MVNLEVMKQLDSGKNMEEIEVKLLFSKLKPLHPSWLIELYNHFTSTAGKEARDNVLLDLRQRLFNHLNNLNDMLKMN